MVYGFTSMCMGALLVHFAAGTLVQIEMHFYFFALLVMLCAYAKRGGEIKLDSQAGKGTKILFRFPMSENVYHLDNGSSAKAA